MATWVGSALPALVLLALWLMATLGLRPLLLPDEGRYASVALEMLHGDGWLPTLNGLPFFHKPPLFYWVDMAAMHLFGVGPFSARVGSLLGGLDLGCDPVPGLASLAWVTRRHHCIDGHGYQPVRVRWCAIRQP